MSSDYSNISQFFSHPLVLLLIGALISGVLIPYFTNRAAKYQKGLEIKTDLVRRINESVIPVIISLLHMQDEMGNVHYAITTQTDKRPPGRSGFHFRKEDLEAELREIKKQLDQDKLEESSKKTLEQKQKEVSEQLEKIVEAIKKLKDIRVRADNEIRQWQVPSSVIESQIKSYFPEFGQETERKLTWNSFSKTVIELHKWTTDLYLDIMFSEAREYILWSNVTQKVWKEKNEIITQIQNSSVSGLSEDLFHRFIRKNYSRPESNKPDEKINHESNQ